MLPLARGSGLHLHVVPLVDIMLQESMASVAPVGLVVQARHHCFTPWPFKTGNGSLRIKLSGKVLGLMKDMITKTRYDTGVYVRT